MKDIHVLLVLLSAHTTKVWALPYQADSDGNCRNVTEYLREGFNLCCKKCPPGQRLIEECSETQESVCKPCQSGQYMENWNYAKNCFSCKKCKQSKGLRNAQTCSSTTMSKCHCQRGMYCIMEFNDPYCSECKKYSECKAGYGVSSPGTINSDVKCERCPTGTFSNTVSNKDPCQPHTNCHGMAVVQKGNTTSDTVCVSEDDVQPHTKAVYTSVSATKVSATTVSATKVSATTVSATKKSGSTTLSSLSQGIDNKLVAAIAGATAIIFILTITLVLIKLTRKKGNYTDTTKLDANGNCESGDNISQHYWGQTQLTITSPEQQFLLEKGEASNDYSQCSSNTETLTRTDGCSSDESISPLQSTITYYNPHSALSEPMPLMSNTEPTTPQSSIPTQLSSQPTSPQIISPDTTSPLVNVNITVHIGNGSPSIMPTESSDEHSLSRLSWQTDPKLPYGKEEECFSIPQQEAGKQSLMSVQESTS
ncbi:hypothetical protein PAMP_017555 [Pampus punctatissimus]